MSPTKFPITQIVGALMTFCRYFGFLLVGFLILCYQYLSTSSRFMCGTQLSGFESLHMVNCAAIGLRRLLHAIAVPYLQYRTCTYFLAVHHCFVPIARLS